LPGIKSRDLKTISRDSVAPFFYWKWNYRNNLDERVQQLKSLLGSAWDFSYGDFLRYIHCDELALSEAERIGQGSFGTVYRVPWRKKPVTKFDHVDEVVGDIALKFIHKRDRSEDKRWAKFISEVKRRKISPFSCYSVNR
jgi:hypothetical protein